MNRKKSNAKRSFERSLDEAAAELEALGDEIRVKLHLASMDATSLWAEKLEPRLFEARVHAREAKGASLAAVEDTIDALKEFAAAL